VTVWYSVIIAKRNEITPPVLTMWLQRKRGRRGGFGGGANRGMCRESSLPKKKPEKDTKDA
jgi:hypothetical protein